MQQGKGVISSNDLMLKLVQAKKVMSKVDNGDYTKGNVNENILRADPEEVMSHHIEKPITQKQVTQPNIEKINNSKLPDVIKKAMIENPIPQISLNETIDMDFVKGAKRLMEREGLSKKSTETKQTVYHNNIDMNSLNIMIENTIRKVLDEKLNQILTAQQTASINENLVLKVGDSIFKGKITGVNKAK
jgi:hypothetical protein